MELSKYQKDILSWLENGKGNATCNAVAGSGKTTTLKLAAQKIQSLGTNPSHIKVIVFGKQNSLDLLAKFGGDWKSSIQTLHSAGFRILQQEIGRFQRNEKIISCKYRRIAEDKRLIPKKVRKTKYPGSLTQSEAISKVDQFLKLIDLSRLTLSDLSIGSISQICNHHNLEGIHDMPRVSKAIADILITGQEQAIDKHRIDYTDMIWLPVEWALNTKPWFKTYQWVLTDECQDLNAAQLELSLMLAGNQGRMLYVGDPKQSIYGFAGADNHSYQKIVDRTNATQLPLSLCYRCPKSHLDLVNKIFPEISIKATENAIPGILQSIQKSDLWDEKHSGHLILGDIVLSRKTAPLVSLCIKLISRGIAATVKGKDIGKQIKNELETISEMEGFRYQDFNIFIKTYKQFKFQAYENLDNAKQLQANLADKLEALQIIYTSQPNSTSIVHLSNYIDDLFSDQDSPITLCTCHRAKGLEGDRIFIAQPGDMPMVWENQLSWQKEQENNLLYVALTRSKFELYIIGNPDWFQAAQAQAPVAETKKDTNNDLSSTSVKGLQLDSKPNASTVMNLIADLDYEERCNLFVVFNKNLAQEKHNKVIEALETDPNRSDRIIASFCFTTAPTVSKIRKQLIREKKIEVESTRIGKKGKKYKIVDGREV